MRILVNVFSFLIFLSLAANTHAQEHVSLLKKSVEEWNQWRNENPEVTPDLEGASLSKANLAGANLTKANLHMANLFETNLKGAKLQGVKNLNCKQISWVKKLDKKTKFPDYLEVKITGENRWTCKEVKMKLTSRNDVSTYRDIYEDEQNLKAK